MAIRSSTRSSRGASSLFQSLANNLRIAQQNKEDNDYSNGITSDADYLATLRQRKANTTNPATQENIGQTILKLTENIQRKVITADIEAGKRSYFELAQFEQGLLENKVPGSTAYIEQKNRYDQVKDAAASQIRKVINQQVQNGTATNADLVNVNQQILGMYEEDGTESQGYQDNLFQLQDSQRKMKQDDFRKQKSLEDAKFSDELRRAQASNNYGQAMAISQAWDKALVERYNNNTWAYTDTSGNPTADYYRLDGQRQSLANTVSSIQTAASAAIEKGIKNEFKGKQNELTNRQKELNAQIDQLEKTGTVISDDGSILRPHTWQEYVAIKGGLLNELNQENTNLYQLYGAYNGAANLDLTGQMDSIAKQIGDTNSKIQSEIDPYQGSRPDVVSMWDGTKYVPYVNKGLGQPDFKTGGIAPDPITGEAGVSFAQDQDSGNNFVLGKGTTVKTVQQGDKENLAGLPVDSQLARVGDNIYFRQNASSPFQKIDGAFFDQISQDPTILNELGFDQASQDRLTEAMNAGQSPVNRDVQTGATVANGADLQGGGTPDAANMLQGNPTQGASAVLQGVDVNQKAAAKKADEDRQAAEAAKAAADQAQLLQSQDLSGGQAPTADTPLQVVDAPVDNRKVTVKQAAPTQQKIKVVQPGATPNIKVSLPPVSRANVRVVQPSAGPNIKIPELTANDFSLNRVQGPKGIIGLARSVVGGQYNYKFKVNPDKSLGIDFFQGNKPIDSGLFQRGTGRSLQDIQNELRRIVSGNPNLVKQLTGGNNAKII